MISGFVMAHVYRRAFMQDFRGNYLAKPTAVLT